MTTLYSENPPADTSLLAAPSSGVGIAQPEAQKSVYPSPALIDVPPGAPNEGVGLASPQAAPAEEIGPVRKALYNFGAGLSGRPGYDEHQIDITRKKKQNELLTLKETTDALEHGVKLAQGMEGEAKKKFIDTYANRLDAMDKGLGETYRMAADRPDIAQNLTSLIPYLPESMQFQAKNDPAGFLKTIGTGDGIKAIDHAKSQFNIRTATTKARMILTHAQQLGVPDELVKEFQANPTASVFHKMEQAAMNPSVKLTPDEQSAVASNADVFYGPLGMMTPKGEEAIREDKAKKLTISEADKASQAETEKHHRALEQEAQARIDQEKFSAPVEVSIEGKNTMVRQDKKSGKLFDPNGKDVTDKIAPQIKGSPLDPGRISMALQAHKDITDARAMLFDKDGNLNRSVIAAMDVPGTKGVGTEGRKAYSAIENAVAAKLRGETGAATNPGEIENTAARFRPTLMDTKESAKYKMDRLQEFMGMTLDQLKESYHISQETYDKAKGGSRGDRGSEPKPMPQDKSALVPGDDYITSRGVATWNGTAFVPKKKK